MLAAAALAFVGEFALYAGAILYLHASLAWTLVASLALGAALLVIYMDAKAAALHVPAPGGPLPVLQRVGLLVVGAGATAALQRPEPLVIALGLIAAIGNAGAMVRFVRIRRSLR